MPDGEIAEYRELAVLVSRLPVHVAEGLWNKAVETSNPSAIIQLAQATAPNCHNCQRSGELFQRNGFWWCVDRLECDMAYQRRLGVPKHVRLEYRARERLLAATKKSDEDVELAARLRELPRRAPNPEYEQYIHSSTWEAFRLKQLEAASYRCEDCGRVFYKGLHVHHLHYRNFKDETPNDVLVLCEICHEDWEDLRKVDRQYAVEISFQLIPVPAATRAVDSNSEFSVVRRIVVIHKDRIQKQHPDRSATQRAQPDLPEALDA